MTSIASLVSAYGEGLLHKRDLVLLGATDRHLTFAVRSGQVRRARRGWYTTFAPGDPRFVAVRVGGRLTGTAALALLGAWMWRRHPEVTVSVAPNAARLRRSRDATVVWDTQEVTRRGGTWTVDPLDALREALLQVSFEGAVALLDWALHTRLVSPDDVPDLCATLPRDARAIADWVDPECESFLESTVRTRARLAGYTVASQVVVNRRQRIDLVIDDVVALEVDGREFHGDSFENDRRKDLEIVVEGRLPLHLSYTMVRDSWSKVLAAIEVGVGMHRRGAAHPVGNSGRPRPVPGVGRRQWRIAPPRRRLRPELPTTGRASPRRRARPAPLPQPASASYALPAPSPSGRAAARPQRPPGLASIGG